MIAEPTKIAPHIWTYTELQRFDDEIRRELYDGEIFEMPSPSLNHQTALFNLAFFLKLWSQANGGRVFLSPVDLHVSERHYFIPDLCFYTAQSLENEAVLRDPQKLTVPPDLIIEVLSDATARNDRVLKMNAYAAFGVRHYWLVDPRIQTFEALELHEGHYLTVAALTEEATFEPGAFADLSIELRRVFELT